MLSCFFQIYSQVSYGKVYIFKYIMYILIYITIYYYIHIVHYAGSYIRVYSATQIRTVLGPCCSR
jgi:hypothetical protein